MIMAIKIQGSTRVKVSALGLLVAFVVHVIGFATTSWCVFSDFSGTAEVKFGIWKACLCEKVTSLCVCLSFDKIPFSSSGG